MERPSRKGRPFVFPLRLFRKRVISVGSLAIVANAVASPDWRLSCVFRRGVVGSRLKRGQADLPDSIEKVGGGLEQARSLKYSRACAALQAGAICVGIGINLAILRRFWV
jgi:hypothetical protein